MTTLDLISLLVFIISSPVSPHLSTLTHQDLDTDYRSQYFSELKSQLSLSWQRAESLEETWSSLLQRLERRLEAVRGSPGGGVPTVSLRDIKNNGGNIPAVALDKAQMKARSDPNMEMISRSLMKAWSSNSSQSEILRPPLVYWDRIQRRPPQSVSYSPLHLDNGGEERWEDVNYFRVYSSIFSGSLDEYDPWLLDHRVNINMNLHERRELGKTFSRTFQGFLSLSSLGPGRGGLKVVPVLEEVTQYIMLRPLLSSVPADVLPGVSSHASLHLSHLWHSHLHKAAVTLHNILPGDAVFFHPDILHGFETENSATEPVTLLYLGLGPDCPLNRHYQRRLQHSLVQGSAPPDFPPGEAGEVTPALHSLSPRELTALGLPSHSSRLPRPEHAACSRDV